MGRISAQQVRVFALFSVAFVMSGLCSTFAHLHQNTNAIMTGALALALIVTMTLETYREK